MGRTVLVTGAAGFIGHHLALRLHERGYQVIGYDNFNDYYDPNLKRAREKRLQEKGIPVIQGDICDSNALEQLFVKYHFTHIVHLAAQAGVRYSLENPQAYVTANLQGFVSMLELCRQQPHIRFIYASSSSVYGLNSKMPFSEKDPTDSPVSLYAATKKSNEVLAHSYHHLYGIPVTGLRFFTVYGPWGRPDMAYFAFTKAVLEGAPIKLFNGGQLRRDFTYIDDIVDGIVAAVDLAAPYEIFNLGNNKPEELGYFVDLIETAAGKKAIKQQAPMQAGDVLSTYADISHSASKLGYSPKTPLSEGIPKFVEWYKEYLKL